MQTIGGKSFSLDGDMSAGGLEPLRGNGLQNAKEWQVIDGITFLIESIPYLDAFPLVGALPARSVAWKMNAKSKERLAANSQSGKRRKPISVAQLSPVPAPTAEPSKPARMAAAKVLSRQPGVVLDYLFINNTQTNFTFKGGVTTTNVLDAAGHTLASIRLGTNGSWNTLSQSAYDVAGRVSKQTNALNGVTTFSEGIDANGYFVKTNVFPDGGTRIESYFKDVKVKGSVLELKGS